MNLPNYLTVSRILMSPVFFTLLISYRQGSESCRSIALAVFLAACLTDALDGFLARFLKQQTPLGAFLDPIADKLLLLSGFLAILFVPAFAIRPPLWVIVAVVFRDVLILGGILVIFLASGTVRITPNVLGKVTTALQMMTLIAILMQWSNASGLWYLMAFFTIISGLAYIWREKSFFKGSVHKELDF